MRALLLFLSVTVFACGPSAPSVPSVPKTIVLVTIDTLRADHTSAFGYVHDTTPNLKALAARGTAFELCHAQHVETGPSIDRSAVVRRRSPGRSGPRGCSSQRGFQRSGSALVGGMPRGGTQE